MALRVNLCALMHKLYYIYRIRRKLNGTDILRVLSLRGGNMGYVKCPRCDLNYMKDDEKYCDVCKAELKIGPALKFAALIDDDEMEQVLCPICKTRYIESEDYNACEYCRNNALRNNDIEQDVTDDDESWRQYLDDDEKAEIANRGDEEESILLSQIEKEEAFKDEMFNEEEEEDEFVYSSKDDDDFNYDVSEEDFEDFEEEEEEEYDEE